MRGSNEREILEDRRALLKFARAGFYGSEIFGQLRIGRVCSAQAVDVTGDGSNFAGLEHAFPGNHALLRDAVPNGGHVIDEVGAVDPIVVREVRAHEPAGIRAMAWRA